MSGMMMSPTSEVTIAPKAAPMMTATARSTTLPFMAKSRNSLSMGLSLLVIGTTKDPAGSVDQAGVHHGIAHRDAGRLGRRNYRQAQLLVHLAEQGHGIFDRRRTGLGKQVDVERHQFLVRS